jgi:hypothetical protein
VNTARHSLPTAPPPALSLARDAALFIALTAAAALLYTLDFQVWLWGDGPALVEEYLGSPAGEAVWMHPGYFRLADALGVLPLLSDGLVRLQALSVICSALTVGLTYLLARLLRCGRVAAAGAAGLLALAPATWFFATLIEVYPPHMLASAAYGVLILALPWRRVTVCAAIIGAAWPLLYWTHLTAPVLGPAWFVIALGVARLRGCSLDLRLVLVVGGALLAGFLLALGLSPADVPLSGGSNPDEISGFLQSHRKGAWSPLLLGEFLVALGVLLPLSIAGGILAVRRHPLLGSGLVCLTALSLGFSLWYGHTERGGYFASSLPIHAALAGLALWRLGRAAPWVLLVALPIQAAVGWQETRSGHSALYSEDFELRVRAIEESVGSEAVLVVVDFAMQPVKTRLPGIEEINLAPILARKHVDGVEPPVLADEMAAGFGAVFAGSESPVGFDLSYRKYADKVPELVPYLDAIEAALMRDFEFDVHDFDDRSIWVAQRRRDG